MNKPEPIELYINQKVLDLFTVAVSELQEAVKRATRPGEVGRCLSIARTHAETAELWLQAAERWASAEAARSIVQRELDKPL